MPEPYRSTVTLSRIIFLLLNGHLTSATEWDVKRDILVGGHMQRFHLYVDDSGTRQIDRKPSEARKDGMDYFALGGILIAESDLRDILAKHKGFMDKWQLKSPLHSTKIRGQRKEFAWLGQDEQRKAEFLSDLEALICGLPIIAIACVIDRPGYVARYADQYKEPWLLCKTAFAILIERAAKYAAGQHGWLEIYVEQAGEKEDRDILTYARSLEIDGMPFSGPKSAAYEGLKPEDFQAIIVGKPNRVTKSVAMIQLADLVLYPLVKGGYDAEYRPYRKLFEAKRVIDSLLEDGQREALGVKYSCFDKKNKARI